MIAFRAYFFFFNDTATTEIYTLSLHYALPISDIAHRLRIEMPSAPVGAGRGGRGSSRGKRRFPTRLEQVTALPDLVFTTLRSVCSDALEQLLGQAFPDASELSVDDRTGGGDHFQVTVASRRFEGLSLVEQHRLVYDALAEPLADGTIHELRIKTKGSPMSELRKR